MRPRDATDGEAGRPSPAKTPGTPDGQDSRTRSGPLTAWPSGFPEVSTCAPAVLRIFVRHGTAYRFEFAESPQVYYEM